MKTDTKAIVQAMMHAIDSDYSVSPAYLTNDGLKCFYLENRSGHLVPKVFVLNDTVWEPGEYLEPPITDGNVTPNHFQYIDSAREYSIENGALMKLDDSGLADVYDPVKIVWITVYDNIDVNAIVDVISRSQDFIFDVDKTAESISDLYFDIRVLFCRPCEDKEIDAITLQTNNIELKTKSMLIKIQDWMSAISRYF